MDSTAFIKKVLEKKELQGVSPAFVKELLETRLKKIQGSLSPRDEKILLKDIRAELRQRVGRFQTSRPSKDKTTDALVQAHTSTRERLPHYDVLRRLIDEHTPKSILDIGCGLNPLVLAKPGQTYYACDINTGEIQLIADHFKKKGIKGEAFVADARTYSDFPSADLCLILKLLDLLDTKGRKNAEALLVRVPCRTMIVSFPTRKLSGKRMNRPTRFWMEKLLERHAYTFKRVDTDNELFYVIKKP